MAKKKPKRPRGRVLPDGWAMETCYLCDLWPISLPGGLPEFAFGRQGDSHAVSKLTRTRTETLAGAIEMAATVELDPGAIWVGDDDDRDCAKTPRWRCYVEAPGWASSGDPDDRWWAGGGTVSVPLTPGTHAVTVPLDPAHWTNVQGKRATESAAREAAWRAVLAKADRIGGTFGCNGNYGHGVFLRGGGGRMRVTGFQVAGS